MTKNKTKKRVPIFLLTAVFMIVLCVAVSAAALIVPYERAQTYLNIVFMDQMKITPSAGLNGLVMTENEISTELPADEAELAETGEIIRPSFGEQYAVLQCDKLTAPVYWGSTSELLEHGACQATSSVVIGETGNVVIDAHVNTFFADLNRLEPGEEVVLFTKYGIFTYTVREQVTFENTDKTYIVPLGEDQLTLYTCQAQVLGTSSTRIGVLCDLVSKQFYTAVGEEDAA